MTFENDLMKVTEDGGCVDIDFLAQPEGGAWIGYAGVDVRLLRVPGVDGEPATLLVSVWEPGVVSRPLAELDVLLEKGSE